MSLVASRVSLTHRCTIERGSASDDDWGTPGVPDWEDHLTDLPCRLWASTGREVIANQTTLTPVEDLHMILSIGTDVTTSDRVAVVTYRSDTIAAGPLGIRAILPRRDHLELLLVRVA